MSGFNLNKLTLMKGLLPLFGIFQVDVRILSYLTYFLGQVVFQACILMLENYS